MTALEDSIVTQAEVAPMAHAALGLRKDSSAGKTLALLDAFAGSRALLGVTDLAARVDLPKATAHRLLAVLVNSGFVRRVGNRYCLGERTFVVGNEVRACKPNGFKEKAMPYLTELFVQCGEVIHLGILSGDSVLYLEKLFGHGAVPCPTSIGGRRPTYATALGKALLAFSPPNVVEEALPKRFERLTPFTLSPAQLARSLSRIQDEGVAFDREELQRGLWCVAAPVVDSRTGKAVAAISVSFRGSSLAEGRHRKALKHAAHGLSTSLSTGPRPAVAN